VAEPSYGPGIEPIEVAPVVVLSQVFPARPSSIPDIRNFVRHCLAESPLTEEGTREVGETVFRALLDAAGPTGSIHVAFRIFPEHVEVDVLHSDSQLPVPDNSGRSGAPAAQGGAGQGYAGQGYAGQGAGGYNGGGPGAGGYGTGGPDAGGQGAGGQSWAGQDAAGPSTDGRGAAGQGTAGPESVGADGQPLAGSGVAGSDGAGYDAVGNGAAAQATAADEAAKAAALSPSGPVALGGPGQPATFAEWMSSSLRSQNMTQEAAARQLGVSVKTISRWVGGTTEPRMRDLRRIQEVFGTLPLP
jgi:hypothetical protein